MQRVTCAFLENIEQRRSPKVEKQEDNNKNRSVLLGEVQYGICH